MWFFSNPPSLLPIPSYLNLISSCSQSNISLSKGETKSGKKSGRRGASERELWCDETVWVKKWDKAYQSLRHCLCRHLPPPPPPHSHHCLERADNNRHMQQLKIMTITTANAGMVLQYWECSCHCAQEVKSHIRGFSDRGWEVKGSRKSLS